MENEGSPGGRDSCDRNGGYFPVKAKRNPLQTSIISDNNISGYLRRHTAKGRAVTLHRKRYYMLDGAVLSKHISEDAPATLHVNILGSRVQRLGKLHFCIAIQNVSPEEPGEKCMILYAKSGELCERWVACLHSAATRTLETHYRIGEIIGEGGFASVRIGESRETGETVAIKTIRKEEEYMQLYGREIAIIKRVEHPNIVRTYDLFETDKKIHIVMEYMRGGMLFEAIEDGTRFSEVDVAQLMREILHGVMYLHEMGVVHRDIKPENVLCTDSQPPWHVKIADFGLSKFTQNGVHSSEMLMQTMIGTPEFIAPEIAARKDYTSKVDLWAVGMLMYNVVTGKLPFEDHETNFVQKLRQGLELRFPEKEWREYSREARLFIRALLCEDPEKRLTALGALVHPWLDDAKRFGSSRFSIHGRFSVPAIDPSLPFVQDSGNFRARPSMLFGTRKKSKPSWLVAYLAVRAMNRLLFLVRPERRKPRERVHDVFASSGHSSASDGRNLEREYSTEEEDSIPSLRNARFDLPAACPDTLRTGSFEGGPKSARVAAMRLRGLPSPRQDQCSPVSQMNSKPRRKDLSEASESAIPSPLRKASGMLFGGNRAKTQTFPGGTPQGPSRKASGLTGLTTPLRKASGLANILANKAPSRKPSIRAMFKKPESANRPSRNLTVESNSAGDGRNGIDAEEDENLTPLDDETITAAAAAEFDKALGLGDLRIQEIED